MPSRRRSQDCESFCLPRDDGDAGVRCGGEATRSPARSGPRESQRTARRGTAQPDAGPQPGRAAAAARVRRRRCRAATSSAAADDGLFFRASSNRRPVDGSTAAIAAAGIVLRRSVSRERTIRSLGATGRQRDDHVLDPAAERLHDQALGVDEPVLEHRTAAREARHLAWARRPSDLHRSPITGHPTPALPATGRKRRARASCRPGRS